MSVRKAKLLSTLWGRVLQKLENVGHSAPPYSATPTSKAQKRIADARCEPMEVRLKHAQTGVTTHTGKHLEHI